MREEFQKPRARLESEQGHIALVTHEHPDGDAVGATLALGLFLAAHGKGVSWICRTKIPYRYDFLPGVGDFKQEIPPDAAFVVLVDTPDMARSRLSWDGAVMRVDHHAEGLENEWSIVDPAAASTGSILLGFMREWDEPGINEGMALCLYTAILTDTNSFTIRTDGRVLRDAAWLLEGGIDGHWVADRIYRRRTSGYLKLLARALESLSVEMDGAFALVMVRGEDFVATGARGHEAESLVDYPFSLDGVLVACKIQQDHDLWRVSLRSRGDVSAERIAKELGGGGHFHAAGAVVQVELDDLLARLRAAVARELGVAR